MDVRDASEHYKVLHVNRDLGFLDLFSSAFNTAFEITSVEDYTTALDLLRAGSFDAAIVNSHLPDEWHRDSLSHILSQIPIILYAEDGDHPSYTSPRSEEPCSATEFLPVENGDAFVYFIRQIIAAHRDSTPAEDSRDLNPDPYITDRFHATDHNRDNRLEKGETQEMKLNALKKNIAYAAVLLNSNRRDPEYRLNEGEEKLFLELAKGSHQHLSRQTENLSALSDGLSRITSSAANMCHHEDLLQLVCDSLVETAGFRASLALLLDSKGACHAAREAGMDEEFSTMQDSLTDGKHADCFRKLLTKREPGAFRELCADCTECPFRKLPGKEVLMLPLETAEQALGMLVLTGTPARFADPASRALLSSLARTAATLLLNLKLKEENERIANRFREMRAFSDNVHNSVTMPMLLLDEAGTIIRANNAWTRLLESCGLSPDSHGIGNEYLSFWEAVEDERGYRDETILGIRAVIEGKRDEFTVECPIVTSNGEVCHLIRINRFMYGDRSSFTVTHLDITERKCCEEELLKQNKELNDFAFRISHDLKNPLSIVIGYLTSIKQEPDLFNLYYDRVIAQSEKMETFINDLLQLARAGRVLNERTPVDPGLLIHALFTFQKPAEIDARLNIPTPLPTIEGDSKGMELVFTNLLDNAFKYRDPEKETLVIDVTCRQQSGKTVISLRDNGQGIPYDMVDRIFEAGFTIHQKQGTGFGLPIARKIIEAHGGKISAWSEGPGTGATFEITLPPG